MKKATSRKNPAPASLSPIWEFIYIAEALLGLFGSAQTFLLNLLQGLSGLFN